MRFILGLLAALFVTPAHAAFEVGEIVCETTTTTGTGTVNLGGAVTNYVTFVSQIASGAVVPYHIRASDGKLEVGYGVFTDATPDTLSRVATWSTDGSGAELTLPAGTHNACIGPTAAMFFDGAGLSTPGDTLAFQIDSDGTPLTVVTFGSTMVDGSYGHVTNSGDNAFGGVEYKNEYDGFGGPGLYVYQDSATPADNDLVGFLSGQGNNDALDPVEYGAIEFYATDVDVGTGLDGRIQINTISAGSIANRMRIAGGVSIGNSTFESAEDLSVEGGDIEMGNAGSATTNTTLSYASAGELTVEGDAIKHAGLQTMWIPASAMRNSALSPASCGDTYDSGTQDVTITVCAFDTGATEENAEFGFAMPKSWNEGTITMQFAWTNTGGSAAQTVQWKIACTGFGDDDALNTAYPGDVTVSDTFTATHDYTLTAATSAITVQNAAEGDYVNCRIGRDTSVDNLGGDALLIGAKVFWTDNASTLAE